jgi:hypothetical protein
MPEEMDLVKLNAILRYTKEVKHMRIASTSADTLRARANEILKTILLRDIEPSMEKILGRKNLEPSEILRELKRLDPIALGQVSKLIADYITSEKANKEKTALEST